MSPPWVALARMRGGTSRPKDTAIIRLYEMGGVQRVKVSSVCVGRESVRACEKMGTVWWVVSMTVLVFQVFQVFQVFERPWVGGRPKL